VENSWTKSRKVRWRPLTRDGKYFFLGSAHVPGNHPGYRILLEPMEPRILLIPEGTGSIALDDVISRGKRAYRTIERDEMGVIRYTDEAHVGLRYDVRLTGDPPMGNTPRDNLAYLELPENSERLIALAAKLAGSADSSHDKAFNIVQGLKYGYGYSLALSSDQRNQQADNPLDRFLFSRKTGTCEHFATALALLLRAQNIPSRLITGFSGAQWNSIGGYWTVSQNFAHSWVEAYLGGKWVTLDATPSADNNVLMKRPTTWAMVLDSIRKIWQDRVVGYDIASQSKLAIGLWRAWIRNFGGRNGVPSLPYKLPLFIFALVTVGGGLIIFAYRRGYLSSSRTSRRPAGSQKKHREATRLYARLDRKLSQLGYPRPRMRTPIEHAEIIEKKDAALAAIVIDITTRYNEVRFGDQDFGPDELKTLKNTIKRIGLEATPQS
jgi:transglutaminase-like putative cysteine protease